MLFATGVSDLQRGWIRRVNRGDGEEGMATMYACMYVCDKMRGGYRVRTRQGRRDGIAIERKKENK